MLSRKLTSAANQGEDFQIESANSTISTTSFNLPFSSDNANSIIFLLVAARKYTDVTNTFTLPAGWTTLIDTHAGTLGDEDAADQGVVEFYLLYRRPGASAISGPAAFSCTQNAYWRGVSWIVKDQNPNVDPIVSTTINDTNTYVPDITLNATNMRVFSGWIVNFDTAASPVQLDVFTSDTTPTTPPEEFYFSGGSSDLAGHILVAKHPDLQGIDYDGNPDYDNFVNNDDRLSTFQLAVPSSSSQQFILSATSSSSITPKNTYATTGTITVTSTGAFTATCASGMEISTDGGSNWSSSASLNQSDTFILRAQNTNLSSTSRALTITIGGATTTVYTFTVDSRPKSSDTVSTKTNAGLSTVYTSDITTISNLSASETVTISGTGSSKQFRINGGSWVTSGTISNGQTLQVRQTSSSSTGTSTTSIAQVGGVTVHTQTVTTYNNYVRYVGSTTAINGSITSSYVVPDGITSISIACIGGGSCGGANVFSPTGGENIASAGGGGGGFSASNGVSVTPGETLTVVVPNRDVNNTQNAAARVHRSGTNLCRANCAPPNSSYTTAGSGASTTGAVGTLVTRSGGAGGPNGTTNRGGQGGGSGTPTGNGLTGATSTSNGVAGTSRQGINPGSTGFSLSTASSPTKTGALDDRGQDGRNYGGGGGGAASVNSTNAARYDGDGAPGAVVILVGRNFSSSSLSY